MLPKSEKLELKKVGDALAYQTRKLHQAALDPEDVTPAMNPEDQRIAQEMRKLVDASVSVIESKADSARAVEKFQQEARQSRAEAELLPDIEDVETNVLPELRAVCAMYEPMFEKLAGADRLSIIRLPGRQADKARLPVLIDEGSALARSAVGQTEAFVLEARAMLKRAGTMMNQHHLRDAIRNHRYNLKITRDYAFGVRNTAQTIIRIFEASTQYQD